MSVEERPPALAQNAAMPELPPAPDYLPHLGQAEVLTMGLSRLESTRWIETDRELADFHRHKRDLAAQRLDAVFAVLPEAESAARELAALLQAHLLTDQAAYYRRERSPRHDNGYSQETDPSEARSHDPDRAAYYRCERSLRHDNGYSQETDPSEARSRDPDRAAYYRRERSPRHDNGSSQEAGPSEKRLLDGHADPGAIHCPAAGIGVNEEEGHPLWRASLLVADDLALMLPGEEGYRLGAASLCSPSHWRLADKLGRPMRAMHDPIPGIHDDLSARIDRFFGHLRVDAPVQRFNWSLQFGGERFCPGHDMHTASTELYYRLERQTLRRLPDSDAIAFTIRVYLHPVTGLAEHPGALPSLAEAVRSTPPALAAYKGFGRYQQALEALINAQTQN